MGKKLPMIVIACAVLILLLGGGGWLIWSWHNKPGNVVVIPSLAQPSPPQPRAPEIVNSIPQTGPSTGNSAPIAMLLQSGDAAQQDQAVKNLHALAGTDPRTLALSLPQWIGPLMADKRFADVQELALAAILERPFDSALVQQAQRARVEALLSQEKYSDALKEAKSFYNVAPQQQVAGAIELLATILVKTTDADTAAKFKADQMAGKSSLAILQSVQVDSSAYEATITTLESHRGKNGTYSPSNWTARGNLWLLADKPGTARDCFVQACPGSATRALRLALEGYAASMRAAKDNPADGDKFVTSLQGGAADLVSILSQNGSPSSDDLIAAAGRIRLSQTGSQSGQ